MLNLQKLFLINKVVEVERKSKERTILARMPSEITMAGTEAGAKEKKGCVLLPVKNLTVPKKYSATVKDLIKASYKPLEEGEQIVYVEVPIPGITVKIGGHKLPATALSFPICYSKKMFNENK